MTTFAIFLATAAATAASAATIRYDYQGNPMTECREYSVCSHPAFSGSITIDESRLPGGSLSNASVTFRIETGFMPTGVPDDPYVPANQLEVSVQRPEGAFTALSYDPGEFFYNVSYPSDWAFSGLVDFTGHIYWFLSTTVLYGYLTLEFDAQRNITGWRGGNHLGAGYSDPFTNSTFGDTVSGAYTPIPGTWKMAWSDPPLAPVPLPSAVSLSLAALGALFVVGRRKRNSGRVAV